MSSRDPCHPDHSPACCLATAGVSIGKSVGALNRCLVTSVLPANWDTQVHESSLLNKQLLSICCDQSELGKWLLVNTEGSDRAGWGEAGSRSRSRGAPQCPGHKASSSKPAQLSHSGGEAFEVTDHQ